MENALLQVVPIDPMAKDVYRLRNVCQVGSGVARVIVLGGQNANADSLNEN